MSSRSSKRRTSLVEMTVVKVTPYLRPEKPLLWLSEREVEAPPMEMTSMRGFLKGLT